MPKLVKLARHNDLYSHAKHGTLYLRLYSATVGVRFVSLRVKRLTHEALSLADEIRRAFHSTDENYQPIDYRDVADMCFNEHFNNPDRPKRQRTKASARAIYDQLIKAFGPLKIDDVTEHMWSAQLSAWRKLGTRRAFRHIRVYAVQIDRFAVFKGFKKARTLFSLCDPDPSPGRVYSDAEFERVFSESEAMPTRESRRNTRLFLLCARFMGMRRNEILGLTWDRVDFARGVISLGVSHTKIKRSREMAIPDRVLLALKEQLEHRTNEFVFRNRWGSGRLSDIAGCLKALTERVGFPVRLHDLRHTFLTVKLCHEKKHPMDVAIYAGVSLSTIERVYLHPRAEDTSSVVAENPGTAGKEPCK